MHGHGSLYNGIACDSKLNRFRSGQNFARQAICFVCRRSYRTFGSMSDVAGVITH